MPTYLARIGVTVCAVLFATAMFTEHQAAGRALVAKASPADEPVAFAAGYAIDRPVAAAPAVVPAVVPAVSLDGIILASWYGPGFYGNRTACGQVYTSEIQGVAHLTLGCGTQVTLTYGGRAVTVPVIDRGPYIAGRAIDLSNATKLALGCTDLCTLRMQVLR